MNQFEEDLLVSLSPVEWKVTSELTETVQKKRKARGKKRWEIDVGRMYATLDKFEEKGWIASRTKTDTSPEKLAKRGGRKEIEWLLTSGGVKARLEQTTQTRTSHAAGQLVPKLARSRRRKLRLFHLTYTIESGECGNYVIFIFLTRLC